MIGADSARFLDRVDLLWFRGSCGLRILASRIRRILLCLVCSCSQIDRANFVFPEVLPLLRRMFAILRLISKERYLPQTSSHHSPWPMPPKRLPSSLGQHSLCPHHISTVRNSRLQRMKASFHCEFETSQYHSAEADDLKEGLEVRYQLRKLSAAFPLVV